jgi:hypothetical protein
MLKSGSEAGVDVVCADQRTVGGCSDQVAAVDEKRLAGSRTLRDAVKKAVDVAYPVVRADRPGRLLFEGLAVGSLSGRIVGYLAVRQVPFQQHIARDADHDEREEHRRNEANAERKRRPILSDRSTREQPSAQAKPPATAGRRQLQSRGLGRLRHHSPVGVPHGEGERTAGQ